MTTTTRARRRGRWAAAATIMTLTLTACGVEIDPGDDDPVQAADGMPGPEPTSSPDDQADPTEQPTDIEPTDTEPTADDPGADDPTDNGDDGPEPGEGTGDDGAEPGTEPTQVNWSLPGADSPEAGALGHLIQTPVESCLAIYHDRMPTGATLEAEPTVRNGSDVLSLRCHFTSPQDGPMYTGTLSLEANERTDTEVQISGSRQSLQRGHLVAELNPYSGGEPDNPTQHLQDVLDDTLIVQPQPYLEDPAPEAVAHDPATRYQQPGRHSEEVIRLYWMTKDPFTACQALLDGTLPSDANIQPGARAGYSGSNLSLNCTVRGGGLTFVEVRAVVHQPLTDQVNEPVGTSNYYSQQLGHVVAVVQTDDDRIDPSVVLPVWHDNLRSYQP